MLKIIDKLKKRQYGIKYFKTHPWAKHHNYVHRRCSPTGKYFKRKIKLLMKVDDFRFLWFRDKAWLLKQPSIDRINQEGNYEFDNCRFIELERNNREKIPWNKGKTNIFSQEALKRIGKAQEGNIPWNKGKKMSPQTKEKLRLAHIGKILSEEHKRKIRIANKGQIPWNKGLKILYCLIIMLNILNITKCYATEMVDMSIIAIIESNNNPLAYNRKSGARGMYQITEICLKDYNAWHPTAKMPVNALFKPVEARKVAEWYLSIRIPQMLRYYGLNDTLENRLICNNAGIGNLVKGIIPKETRNYILKYIGIAKRNKWREK